MATYLQGTQAYIPQIQPYQPDFNFIQNTANTKQTKYDMGKKQLSTTYGSLLNAAMTRDDNIANREQFFKDIEGDIKKMSGMDLSKTQNVEAANEIFSQLLDNKNIAHDMSWTKNFESQLNRSQVLKNQGRRDEGGDMWWEGGDRLLQYAREEYKNASADEALSIGSAEYVPKQDILGRAMKLAKEYKMEVKQDVSNGNYVFTYKNGKAAYAPFQQIFMGTIGNDDRVRRYMQAEATLQMKDFAYSNMDKYGSMEAGEQAYANQVGAQLEAAYNKEMGKTKEQIEKNTETQQKLASYTPDPTDDMEELEQLVLRYQNEGEQLESTRSQLENGKNGTYGGSKYNKNSVIAMMSNMNLLQSIGMAAVSVADMSSEVTTKADPYAMAKYQFDLKCKLEDKRLQNKIELERLKGTIKDKGVGNDGGNAYLTDIKGNLENTDDTKQTMAAATNRGNEMAEISTQIAGEEIAISRAYLEHFSRGAENGNTNDINHYVDIVKSGMNAEQTIYLGQEEDVEFQQQRKEFNDEISNASTAQQRYLIAKRYASKISSNADSQAAMSQYITNSFDPDAIGNKQLLSAETKQMWQRTQDIRTAVLYKHALMDQAMKRQAQNRTDVIQGLKASGDSYGDDRERENLVDYMSSMWKEDGTMATKAETIARLKKTDFMSRNGASEQDVEDFVNATFGSEAGKYERDFHIPFFSGEKEDQADKYLWNGWEQNRGHWWDTDVLFGAQDAFKEIYGKYSRLNADLEGEGQIYNPGLSFRVSGNPDNGMDQYNDQFIDVCQLMTGLGTSEVYASSLSAEYDSDDKLNKETVAAISAQLQQYVRTKDNKDVIQCTFAPVTANSSDKCGFQITLSPETRKNLGDKIIGDYLPQTITVVMNKDEYNQRTNNNNLYKLTNKNMYDKLIKYNGKFDLPSYGISKDMKITKDEKGYHISGSVFSQNVGGKPQYQWYDSALSNTYFNSPELAINYWNQYANLAKTQIMQ